MTSIKHVDNRYFAGDSVMLHPQPSDTLRNTKLFPSNHPHGSGDNKLGLHQGSQGVIHNPQPLLPLLAISISSSLNKGWGFPRKDKIS